MRLSNNVPLSTLKPFFNVHDSGFYYLYHSIDLKYNEILVLCLSNRNIYFVNGVFKNGLKLLKMFDKEGWLYA